MHFDLKPMSSELPENPWLEGDDLHFINKEDKYYIIKDYINKWYVSRLTYDDMDYSPDESITLVGNNKVWN